MKEDEYFYWRNNRGVPERHHISEWEVFLATGQGETTATGENPGESVRPERGKETTETHNQNAVATETATRREIT